MSTISASTTSTTAYKVTADTTGNLVIQTGATPTTALTIDTAQNMGLGVTPSAWSSSSKALQINASAAIEGISAANITYANAYRNASNVLTYIASDYASRYSQSSGVHSWSTAASGTAGNAITFTQAMTLDASGNLSISNAFSSTNAGTFYLSGTTPGDATVPTYSWNADTDTGMYRPQANTIGWSTGGSERARIDSSGNLGVGTASSYAAVAVYVGTATNGGTGQGGVGVNGGSTALIDIGHASGTASGTSYTRYIYNGSVIGSVTQNGTTGVLYNLTSDYRLKNNPVPVTGAKEFIMALQPKTWDWWDGSGKGVGFIAHEFMEVAKHSGNGEKDAVEVVEIKDEEGNVTGTEERPVYQSIQPSSSEVMANLVAHIQNLETRLAALENK